MKTSASKEVEWVLNINTFPSAVFDTSEELLESGMLDMALTGNYGFEVLKRETVTTFTETLVMDRPRRTKPSQ